MSPFIKCPRCDCDLGEITNFCSRCYFKCSGADEWWNSWTGAADKHWYQFYTDDEDSVVIVNLAENETTVITGDNDDKFVFHGIVLSPKSTDEDIYKLLVLM